MTVIQQKMAEIDLLDVFEMVLSASLLSQVWRICFFSASSLYHLKVIQYYTSDQGIYATTDREFIQPLA